MGTTEFGNSEYFILEACEYVESFLKFSPKSTIVLNIDNDHLDYFKTLDNVKLAFERYVSLLPRDGILVTNGDDPNCLTLRKSSDAKFITYGIENTNANFTARNITFDINGFPKFDVYYNNNYYLEVKLSVPGRHNVLNALACIAMCTEYGISKYAIKSALLKFAGANRRFEFIGKVNGFSIYDDYAHHPKEIQATFAALKNKKYRQSWIVFQPHTYSRTKELLDDFAKVLTEFDNIILTDIYAAREKNIFNISSKVLADKIKLLGKNPILISDFNEVAAYVKSRACPNDIVLTVGAGTVVQVAKKIMKLSIM